MGPSSHVGFPISAKKKFLVYDHPMNMSAKFGSNLFCGFRKKRGKCEIPIGSWSLGGQLSKVCPVTLTSIQDGHHQQT
jgi:hypothetical protein